MLLIFIVVFCISLAAGLSAWYLFSYDEIYADRCAVAWEPLETKYVRKGGCLVYMDGHWTPSKNVVVISDGE